MTTTYRNLSKAVVALAFTALPVTGISAIVASSARAQPGYSATALAYGAALFHSTPQGKQGLSGPDDITELGGHLFVSFQNGVGSMGELSTLGTSDSTIVELDLQGKEIAQWDIAGKSDGLGADPATNQVIATVNEDGHSSLYVIKPGSRNAVHYTYSHPLPHRGGTDMVTFYKGMVIISASCPGCSGGKAAPQPYPAAYRVSFNNKSHTATPVGLFSDEAPATSANGSTGGHAKALALTDPDSSSVVPPYAARFGGDFMLDSQGDDQLIFADHLGQKEQSLQVLQLSTSIDDSAWASSSSGAIYTTSSSADAIYKITGPFQKGQMFVVATPCNANNAPSICPGTGFSSNYLAEMVPASGTMNPVTVAGTTLVPNAMVFVG